MVSFAFALSQFIGACSFFAQAHLTGKVFLPIDLARFLLLFVFSMAAAAETLCDSDVKRCGLCVRDKAKDEFPPGDNRCKCCLRMKSKFTRLNDPEVLKQMQQAPPEFRSDFFAEHQAMCTKELKAMWQQQYQQHVLKESEDALEGTGEWLDEFDLKKKYEHKPGHAELVMQTADTMKHQKTQVTLYEDCRAN